MKFSDLKSSERHELVIFEEMDLSVLFLLLFSLILPSKADTN